MLAECRQIGSRFG